MSTIIVIASAAVVSMVCLLVSIVMIHQRQVAWAKSLRFIADNMATTFEEAEMLHEMAEDMDAGGRSARRKLARSIYAIARTGVPANEVKP